MRQTRIGLGILLVALTLGLVGAAPAAAQDAHGGETASAKADEGGSSLVGLAAAGGMLGAGLVVLGGGLGISRVGASATESVARQPEAQQQIFLYMIITAAMIEGVALFGVVVGLLSVIMYTP